MSQPIDELKNRLKKALVIRDLKPVDLVEKTGIPKSAISQYMSGYAKPKQDRIYLISNALNISEAWLMGFDVPMDREEIPMHLSRGEIALLQKFNRLNDIGKSEAQKRIEELTLIEKYTKSILHAAARNGGLKEVPDSDLIDIDIKNTKDPDFL